MESKVCEMQGFVVNLKGSQVVVTVAMDYEMVDMRKARGIKGKKK